MRTLIPALVLAGCAGGGPLPPADPPAGAKMGANLQGDTAMILLLYAPNK